MITNCITLSNATTGIPKINNLMLINMVSLIVNFFMVLTKSPLIVSMFVDFFLKSHLTLGSFLLTFNYKKRPPFLGSCNLFSR